MADRKSMVGDSGVRLIGVPKSDVEPPRGVHGGSDLDRWADALATLAGTARRAFIGGVR